MNNDTILSWVESKMREYGHEPGSYAISTVSEKVEPATTTTIIDANGIYFFTNAFQAGGAVLNGRIQADDNAELLNPLFLNRNFYKLQIFRGQVFVTNIDATEHLYIEFIKCSPIFSSN